MSNTRDWLPTARTGQLTMCKNWMNILSAKAGGWRIPPEVPQELQTLGAAAETALAAAQNEDTRTPVATARCKTAFESMIAALRDTKKRYFYVPPLEESDLVSLGLKLHDTTPTPSGTPGAQVTAETYLVGRHELGVKIHYVTGNPGDAANKGYRIWYSVLGQGETPPENPGELRRSFFTKRKKDVIEFDFSESGKTAYMAIQIENEGKKGPWGPLVSALIP